MKDQLNPESLVRFCVTAYIDLIGFSNQLAVTYRNLETLLGSILIKRLSIIDESLKLLKEQENIIPDLFPKNYNVMRVNDAIVITMDLDEILKPTKGTIHKADTYIYRFGTDNKVEFFKRIESGHLELAKFLCLISRIHTYIDQTDKESDYPGCKTVISSGFRNRYFNYMHKEDVFAANFSFSNAYLAESILKGHNFIVDSNILRILSHNTSFKSIISSSLFFIPKFNYSAKRMLQQSNHDTDILEGKETEVLLFHEKYFFHEVDACLISYLQVYIAFLDFKAVYKPEKPSTFSKDLFEALTSFTELYLKKLRLDPLTIYDDLFQKIYLVTKGITISDSLSLPSYSINFTEYENFLKMRRKITKTN